MEAWKEAWAGVCCIVLLLRSCIRTSRIYRVMFNLRIWIQGKRRKVKYRYHFKPSKHKVSDPTLILHKRRKAKPALETIQNLIFFFFFFFPLSHALCIFSLNTYSLFLALFPTSQIPLIKAINILNQDAQSDTKAQPRARSWPPLNPLLTWLPNTPPSYTRRKEHIGLGTISLR